MRVRALAGALALVTVGGLAAGVDLTSASASAPASGWTVRVLADTSGTVLQSVSCPDVTDCVAVGYATNSEAGASALAESGDVGSAFKPAGIWSPTTNIGPQDATDSRLFSVSCPTTTWCAAVGTATNSTGTHLLVDVFDGASWTPTVLADPAGYVSSPYDAMRLAGVSCWTAGACVAVGEAPSSQEHEAVVETLAGGSWTQAITPTVRYAQLFSVDCRSAARCTAVGSASSTTGAPYQALLSERLGHGTWQAEQFHKSKATDGFYEELSSVSCRSASRCVAVGRSQFLANLDHSSTDAFTEVETAKGWTSKRWGGSTVFYGNIPAWSVSCPSKSACEAVGGAQFGSSAVDATASHGSTGKWKSYGDLAPTTGHGDALLGVDCPSASECVAVGGAYQSITAIWQQPGG